MKLTKIFLKFNLAALFAILILLNLGDAVATSILVGQYGTGVEVNPILRDLIEIYGIAALFGAKYFLISIIGILLLGLKQVRHIMVAQYSLWFVNISYALVVSYGTFLSVISINT